MLMNVFIFLCFGKLQIKCCFNSLHENIAVTKIHYTPFQAQTPRELAKCAQFTSYVNEDYG